MSDNTPGTAPQLPPRLPEKKKGRAGLITGILIGVVVIIVAVVLIVVNLTAAKPAAEADGSAAPVVVKIGTSDASQPYWDLLKEKAAAEGITIETVNFTDYQQPNPALQEGQIDLNMFQHLRFLAQYNVDTDNDLQPIASTLIVPLGLYSQKWTSVDEIPQGGTIAIPNDPSNQARALFVLEAAGLITLTGDKFAPTPADIDTANSRVTVATVDAAQTALSLPSVDGSVINNNYVQDAGIDPKTAIFADDPSSPGAQPYINLIVSRADEVDNPTFAKIAELYHDPEVLEAVVASSNGTAVIVDGYTGEELRGLLADIQKEVAAAE
ncbi:MetQ/NlpA family ABC transporter substrate-binding protein [Compostimonas suwonensis]|uniref:D-methionine transport system substrate-binding protein n=1 Tax=Compostimonas suwonensis TaxID=1048394 RepID=A0A2M9BB44_9MICO|nr:MetQ/NlpA family ABC transporter substrate-binding protein [Compostimonas suwonensis]PJJ55164.1 D-methionine transport system substrate-binding protein [Compostimonas suwonensis]